VSLLTAVSLAIVVVLAALVVLLLSTLSGRER
jgi:hypothetical protein